jgi:hypothetical protein
MFIFQTVTQNSDPFYGVLENQEKQSRTSSILRRCDRGKAKPSRGTHSSATGG